MKKLEYSQFGRQKCGHTIIPLYGPGGSGWVAGFDDAYNMNPRGCFRYSSSLILFLYKVFALSEPFSDGTDSCQSGVHVKITKNFENTSLNT
jgi:hypothetical protein